jgi:hypothetical protein
MNNQVGDASRLLCSRENYGISFNLRRKLLPSEVVRAFWTPAGEL